MDLRRVVPGFRRTGGGRARPDKVAFVLSGGGVLGAMQIGQLEALLRAGITPDLLVGTSVGALNAAAIAAEPTVAGAEHLRDVWIGLRTEDIFPGSKLQRALQFVRKGDHLYPNDGLRRLAEKVPARRFEDLSLPLSICAANLRTGEEHWFEDGPLAPAIMASAAIPGIFPPVVVDGEHYLDGGVVNNVPISRAVELGATTIYVLTCGTGKASERPIQRPFEVLLQAFAHSRARRIGLDLERYAERARIVHMPTFEPGPIGYKDTSHAARLYETALDLATRFLADQPVVERALRRKRRVAALGTATATTP